MHWISGLKPEGEFECRAKFRYRQADQGVKVTLNHDNKCIVYFEKPKGQ